MVEKKLLTPDLVSAQFASSEVTQAESCAWMNLGLIVYFHGSMQPAWADLLKLWDALWHWDFAAGFTIARYWDEMQWSRLGPDSAGLLRNVIEDAAGKRSFWRMELANQATAPDLSFEFCDLDQTLECERASFLRFRFPVSFPPERLVEIAREILVLLPVWHGTAGFMFSVAETERDIAYDQVWAWARRYWGVQVVDTRSGSWDAIQGLLGTNWLTLLGAQFLSEKPLNLSVRDFAGGPVSMRNCGGGVLVQAGLRPILGDLNLFEDVSAYAAAARLLSAASIQEPTPFPGMFTDHVSTLAWIRRFEEPSKWINPELC